MSSNQYVWYACYGSNINYDRFMRYINRCHDTTPPAVSSGYIIPFKLYFAGNFSRTWGHYATAFIDYNLPGQTLGKKYKITRSQLDDVKHQEGQHYTKELLLGIEDGIEIITLTSETVETPTGFPKKEYFDTIMQGLRDQYAQFTEASLAKRIVNSFISDLELFILTTIRTNEHRVSVKSLLDSYLQAHSEQDIKKALIKLLEIKLLQKDRRSNELEDLNNNAEYFTVETERPLIDEILNYQRQWHEELVEINDNDINQEQSMESTVEDSNPIAAHAEGRIIRHYTTRYERSPANRAAAINLHGLTCQVCGFNFLEVYGEIGRNYIEVHHIVPLSDLNAEIQVNPETDLVCVCSNCHRMIHRKRNSILTIEELKSIVHHQ